MPPPPSEVNVFPEITNGEDPPCQALASALLLLPGLNCSALLCSAGLSPLKLWAKGNPSYRKLFCWYLVKMMIE